MSPEVLDMATMKSYVIVRETTKKKAFRFAKEEKRISRTASPDLMWHKHSG